MPGPNRFLGDLIVRELPGGRRWEVVAAFRFHLGSPEGVEYIAVPHGFVTDFASIPRGLWNIWPPMGGKHGKSSVVHDRAYSTGYVSVTDGSVRHITRHEADAIFLEAMGVAGVKRLSRRLIYWGVRLGGGWAWASHRDRDARRP